MQGSLEGIHLSCIRRGILRGEVGKYQCSLKATTSAKYFFAFSGIYDLSKEETINNTIHILIAWQGMNFCSGELGRVTEGKFLM
jgi:hypothetical protein